MRHPTPMGEMVVDARHVFERAVFQLLDHNPFYGNMLMLVRRRLTNDPAIDTAAVEFSNPPTLYVNEKFFLSITEKERTGVLEHEMLHLVMKHDNIRFGKDHYSDANLLNIACDLSINQLIKPFPNSTENRLPLIAQTIEKFGFPVDKTSEWYYQELKKSRDAGVKKILDLLKNGSLNGVPGQKKGCCQPGSGSAESDAEIELAINSLVKEAYGKASQSAKGVGNLPGTVKEYIKRILEPPKVPWYKELRQFTSGLGRAYLKSTTKRISKRYGTIPGTKIKGQSRVAAVIDTSGSISNADLELFGNEIRHISRNGCDVEIVEVDTQVHRSYTYRNRLEDVIGRGGTDLNAFYKWMINNKKTYDGIVFLTDGCTSPLPKTSPVSTKTLWIINKGVKCAEFGKTIHIT